MRLTQVKKLTDLDLLRDHLASLGIEIPVVDDVDPDGILSTPVEIPGVERSLVAPNRFAVLPMEGWDATASGEPTDLVRRRWSRFGTSGCGLVWGEATAVRPDGRANPHQLVIGDRTVEQLASLRELLEPGQIAGLQLTHSGRYARPHGDPAPRTAYEHPILDSRVGATGSSVLSDDELDELVVAYVDAAVLAEAAGFDFVDIKHCHGYLLHELLSGVDRPGRYGGDLGGRTNFLRSVLQGIRGRAPGLAVGVRLSLFDVVPYRAGADGIGVPESDQRYRYAFGGDGTGVGIDLTEPHEFLDLLVEHRVGLLSTTAGSPYYNPHIQRPAYFPPSDGYDPPEDPLVGVARQLRATAEIASRHPELVVVGSGYTYLQQWLAHVAEAVVGARGASMVGLGRMILSYPHMAADVLAGRPLDSRSICRTFSDCTTAPRNGLVSGCFPLDDFYKHHPQRVELAAAKKRARDRRR